MFLVGEGIETRKCAKTTLYTLSKNKIKKLWRKSKKGVDNGWKCGIINKLSRKTAALQKPNKSDVPAKTQRGTEQRAGGKLLKRRLESSKKYRKKCLTKSTTFDIMIELSERRASRTLKIEQYWNLWNLKRDGKSRKTIPKPRDRQTSNSYRTQAIVSEWSWFNTLWVINTIYKEFDPGSGRTLAARLTHASRTELRELAF